MSARKAKAALVAAGYDDFDHDGIEGEDGAEALGMAPANTSPEPHFDDFRDKLRWKWPHGDALCRQMRERIGPRALLKFSGGKDSVCAALMLQKHFDEVVPVFMYIIPDLEFVDEALDYYERKLFHRKIVRVPHPGLFQWLRRFVYQDPIAARVITVSSLPKVTNDDVNACVCASEGLPQGTLPATGIRYSETPSRSQMLYKYGPIGKTTWHPIFDWRKQEALDCMAKAGLRLSGEYEFMGKSFGGIHISHILPIKRHRPNDYAKIVRALPLIEAEIWRHERDHGTRGA